MSRVRRLERTKHVVNSRKGSSHHAASLGMCLSHKEEVVHINIHSPQRQAKSAMLERSRRRNASAVPQPWHG